MTENEKAISILNHTKNIVNGRIEEVLDIAIKALEENQKFHSIGTVEEFKALKEESVPKKVKGISLTHEGRVGNCPTCGKLVRHHEQTTYCVCNQKLYWE